VNRNFWIAITGNAISVLGTSFGQIALAWMVYELTGSKLAMGTLLITGSIPETLLRVLGGPLVDRLNRIRLMRSLDMVQVLLYSVPPILMASGLLAMWHLYIFAALAGLARALYVPAAWSVMPSLVAREHLMRANSIAQSLTTSINLLGPAMAGALVAVVGAVPALVIDAISYAISALMLFLLPARLGQVEQRQAAGSSYLGQLAEGLRFYRTAPALLTIMVGVMSLNFATSASTAMMVPFVRERLGAGPEVVGIMAAMVPAGVLISGLALSWLGEPRRRRNLTLMLPVVLAGAGVIGASLVGEGQIALAAAIIFVIGLGIGLFNPQNATIYQRLVPDNLRGRVQTVRLTLAWGINPVGTFLGSLVATQFGLPVMYLLVGLVPILVGLLAANHRSLATLDADLAVPTPARATA